MEKRKRQKDEKNNNKIEEGKRVLWFGLCPLESSVEALTPVPQNVTLFGNRVVADIMS